MVFIQEYLQCHTAYRKRQFWGLRFSLCLRTSVVSGSVYMFADDTTVYCIGASADKATTQLNLTMHKL